MANYGLIISSSHKFKQYATQRDCKNIHDSGPIDLCIYFLCTMFIQERETHLTCTMESTNTSVKTVRERSEYQAKQQTR